MNVITFSCLTFFSQGHSYYISVLSIVFSWCDDDRGNNDDIYNDGGYDNGGNGDGMNTATSNNECNYC